MLRAVSMVQSCCKKRGIEALWGDFFSNTSQWWDHRPEKINPRFPDFKHKRTGESLWVADLRNPPWVQAELAAIPPGTLQLNVFAWTQRLKRYVKAGQYIKTMEVFHRMQQERICPDTWTFLPVLNACAGLGSLEDGKCIHRQIIQVGCNSDVYIASCLVDMYAKCGSIEDAWSVFSHMQKHNVVSWNAIIGGYVKSGQGLKALELFQAMQQEGVEPDTITFVGVLNACASVAALDEGRRVHDQIIQQGHECNVYVANCLVDMYAKCGSTEDACHVFLRMPDRNVVSWSAMIGGYVKSGQGLKAVQLFREMLQGGVEPNTITFVGVLNACASITALEEGRCIHKEIIRRGCESDVFVGSCLVDMYAKCGSMEDASSVFRNMREPNVVSWGAMIGGYVKSGDGLKAMGLFREMQQKGVEPNAIIFVAVLNACASLAALEEGRSVHGQVIRSGHESNIYVANCLVDMYAKCGSIKDAWGVFKEMPDHNVVSWSAMIGGYVKSGQGLKALELFQKMQQEGVEPDSVTFVAVLKACASAAALEEGRSVHEQIAQKGCESNLFIGSCLVDMYAKCGSIEDAWNVFNRIRGHNVVTWSAMIAGYVKAGQGLKAIELFREMKQEGMQPDAVTFAGVLNACASVAALEEGRRVHEQIIQRGCESDIYVGSCLVDMYAKCGSIKDAWSVFERMQERNVVTWNSIIVGYVKLGQGLKAIELFRKMQQERVEPDIVTFVGVLNACAIVAALEEGKRVHEQIIEGGCESDVYVGSCLVDMYAKCGSIENAQRVFDKMSTRGVVAWTAMIGGYAMHGHAGEAIGLFKQMVEDSIEVNGMTFTCLLSACNHGGLVEEGLRYFKSMRSCFNILPTMEHYACMVDLLGRAGCLVEAEQMMKGMPLDTDIHLWMSLLGACRIHGDIKMAERAAKGCWELDPENVSGYVLLSNMYASARKLGNAATKEES